MRITCPACAAAYDVPDRLVGARRRLRCARCGHDWQIEPGPAAPAPRPSLAERSAAAPSPGSSRDGFGEEAPVARPAAEPPSRHPGQAHPAAPPAAEWPPDRRPAPRRPPQLIEPPLPRQDDEGPGGGRWLLIGWIATILVVLGVIALLLLFRAEIVAAWPPAARLLGA